MKSPLPTNWTCLYNDTYYAIESIRLQNQNIELTLHNNKTVTFEYMSPRWIELTLYIHSANFVAPTLHMWDEVRFQSIKTDLMKLYKAPTNFSRAAQSGSEQMERARTPPCRGFPG